jgi:catechol 2,3-dioxygenase-like lactoylglutathione lyase family enzyme
VVTTFVRFRSARPTNDLRAIERFYVDALGCARLGSFEGHEGFDGLIFGTPDGAWQVEFLRERGVIAPSAPTHEHLLVFYVADRAALAARDAAMRAAGHCPVEPHNPYWLRHGVTFADPEGYRVVIAVPPAP